MRCKYLVRLVARALAFSEPVLRSVCNRTQRFKLALACRVVQTACMEK